MANQANTGVLETEPITAGSGETRFVSNWKQDTNGKDHNVQFEHTLGAVPTSLFVQFTLDRITVYPLCWSWEAKSSGNPVSVWMDDGTITIAITAGASLHGWWNGETSAWNHSTTGYWRVIASL